MKVLLVALSLILLWAGFVAVFLSGPPVVHLLGAAVMAVGIALFSGRNHLSHPSGA